MLLDQETLEIKEGALVIVSSSPMGCGDLQRNLEDTVWTPQLLVAIPPEGNPFVINPGGISLKNTPYFIQTSPTSGCVWHGSEDIMKSIKLSGYYFVAGNLREGLEEHKIHTIQNGFNPDPKDENQSPLDINILSRNEGSFSYTERAALRIHSRKADLPNLIYTIIHSPSISHFGYGCYHSGEFGLNHNFEGQLNATQEQRRETALAITRDLEKSLSLDLLS